MTTTKLDIRKLNVWLKDNVDFYCKAVRRPHMEIVIGADASNNLHAYADRIQAEFGNSIIRMDAHGLQNYITLIAR
jgi:hypothetical protein